MIDKENDRYKVVQRHDRWCVTETVGKCKPKIVKTHKTKESAEMDAELRMAMVSPFRMQKSCADEMIGRLTRREVEVVWLFVLGFTGSEIASKLKLSSKTIEAHTCNVIRKFGVQRTGWARIWYCAKFGR